MFENQWLRDIQQDRRKAHRKLMALTRARIFVQKGVGAGPAPAAGPAVLQPSAPLMASACTVLVFRLAVTPAFYALAYSYPST